MKVDNLCVHIVMDHYPFGIYVQQINLLTLIFHTVNFKKKKKNFEFFSSSFISARISKDEGHKFGPISKVVWSAVKNSYVKFFITTKLN